MTTLSLVPLVVTIALIIAGVFVWRVTDTKRQERMSRRLQNQTDYDCFIEALEQRRKDPYLGANLPAGGDGWMEPWRRDDGKHAKPRANPRPSVDTDPQRF